MDLSPYVEAIQRQLETAAEAAGGDARHVAVRLVAPLDAAMRLALLDALSAATEEITCELAPGSVELRIRGRDLEFVVAAPPVAGPPEADGVGPEPLTRDRLAPLADEAEGGMSRINLRLPEHLKARVERDAEAERISVNAWLVRAAAAALERSGTRPPGRRGSHGGQRVTGWAR